MYTVEQAFEQIQAVEKALDLLLIDIEDERQTDRGDDDTAQYKVLTSISYVLDDAARYIARARRNAIAALREK